MVHMQKRYEDEADSGFSSLVCLLEVAFHFGDQFVEGQVGIEFGLDGSFGLAEALGLLYYEL